MARYALPLCLLAGLLLAEGETPEARSFPTRLRKGDRYTGSNTIRLQMKTLVRQGQRETETSESTQRTERFVDVVERASENGTLEIERTYNMLYQKVRLPDSPRPEIHQSPLQGRTVKIRERRRRRTVVLKGGGTIDVVTRKTAGFELDWRDIFPDDPVRPGDAWEADAQALGMRLAPYLDAGNRSKMKVRYEEIGEHEGRRVAKFYVDWEVTGMRDQHLYTKILLSGDVIYDLDYGRVTEVDLVGTMLVTGAIMGGTTPRIVKGNGTLEVRTQIHPAPAPQAAAPGD